MKSKITILFDQYRSQSREGGMVVVLITLMIGLYTSNRDWFVAAAAMLFLTMLIPALFLPFTVFWFRFSVLLGGISSFLILTLLFCLLVVPVALFRRWAGKDVMMLRQFGHGDDSVFATYRKEYTPGDIDKPY